MTHESPSEPTAPGADHPHGHGGADAPVVVRARALAAADALAPTFPIGTFVAANPLHRLEHHTFEDAARITAAHSGARSFLTEAEYRSLHASGRISDDDLRSALLRRWPAVSGAGRTVPTDPGDPDVELSLATLLQGDPPASVTTPARTLTERADARRGTALADAVDAQVATWCAAYLDQGQAPWVLPHRDLGLYGAWRRLAPRDPALRRLAGRAAARRVTDLPADPGEALAVLVHRWGIPAGAQSESFRAAFRRLPGWASALARSGDGDDLVGFLALRLALEDLALDQAPASLREELRRGRPDHDRDGLPDHSAPAGSIERLAVWQEALELGYRDHLLGLLATPRPTPRPAAVEAQAVFCIDPRSEGMRRHLESEGPYETIGFAGFFGLPVRIARLEHDPVASCPVIVDPRATVHEVPDADPAMADRHHDRHQAVDAAWDARHEAKVEPAAPYAFAEAAGWVLGPLAALSTFAPRAAGRLRALAARRSVPPMPTRMDAGGPGGLGVDEQVRIAHAGLTTMGLTSGFAPLVLLTGHRSATTNNPFAAALDCGACAGKAGGPNARALAELLNSPEVRAGLAGAGITVPGHTWFVAAEHETTTDSVRVLDRHRVPPPHDAALERLERALAKAGAALAQERRAMLPGRGGGGNTSATAAAARRSADWAEPVPEWGLVRNAAVVVGPRSLTRGLDLQRRVFLHSYDPVADQAGAALETILTGPLVVGHWISSQYYFSTVDPVRHGSGTKPLHNVVGGIGVLEGPGGDLRAGLPLESVGFAGERVHEPMRLLAVVQAPRPRLDEVIARNAAVAQLLDNGWIRLVAGSNGGDGWAERRRDGTWATWPETQGPDDPDRAEGGADAADRLDAAHHMAGIMTGATSHQEGTPWAANA